MKKTGTIANAFGPLEYENYRDMLKFQLSFFATPYQRFRAWPVGVTPFGSRDLQRIFGHHGPMTEVMLRAMEMRDVGLLHFEFEQNAETERFTNMQVTVLDSDAIPEHAAKVSGKAATPLDALSHVLRVFAIEYRAAGHVEWARTGKEVGLAKQLLKKTENDADLVCKLIRRFFHMPLEQQIDDIDFVKFYFMFNKLLARERNEGEWDEAKDAAELQAVAWKTAPQGLDDPAYRAKLERDRVARATLHEIEEKNRERLAEEDAL